MNPDFEPLERIVAGELKGLPPLKAPASLMASVLAQVRRAPAAPWWQQSIWAWPSPARVAFLFAAVSILLLACGGTWIAASDAPSVWQSLAGKLSLLSASWSFVGVIAQWAAISWQHTILPWLPYLAGFAVAMYLACLGFGTALVRYTLRHS